MKYTKKILMIIVMLLCFFMLDNVRAEENNTANIICNRGYLYEISSKIENSEYANIARNGGLNLNIGNGTYNDGVRSFQYELLSDTFNDGDYIRCYNSVSTNNYAINDCNEKYANNVEIANLWAEDGKDEQTLDPVTGTITMKIALTGEIANNLDKINLVTKYDGGSAGTITKDYTNRQIIISGITPGDYKDYIIEVYYSGVTASDFNKNTDSINYCLSSNGMLHITTLKTKIKSLNSFTIEIPDSFKNSNVCNDVKNYSNNVLDVSKFFSECYDSKTINYASYQTLESDLSVLFTRLKEAFEVKDIKTLNTENLKCDDANLRIPSTNSDAIPIATRTTTRSTEHWAMTCTDTYYVESGDPALVKAGEGVPYLNKVQIDRSCSIANIKKVVKRPQCSYQSAITCHDSVTNTWRPDAGPNATFDSCVKKCDGGEYTQLCINACYNEVYKNNKSEIIGMKNDDFTKYVAKKIVYTETTETTTTTDENGNTTTTTDTITSGDPVWNGVNLNFWQPIYLSQHQGETIDIGHGSSITVTDVQSNTISNASGTLKKSMIQATLHTTSGDVNVHIANNCLASNQPCAYATWCVNCPNCSDNPEAEYQAAISRSVSEVEGLISTAKSQGYGIVNYNMSFEDTEDGQIYSVDGSTTKDMKGVELDITNDGIKLLNHTVNTFEIGDQHTYHTTESSFTTSITYYINLPKQYTLKNDANVILIKAEDGYYQKVNNNSGKYKFVKYNVANEKLLSSGENCYYTSLAAKDTNREIMCEKNSTGPNSLRAAVNSITELKTQVPLKATRSQLLNYWEGSGIAGNLIAKYSYNAYVAYSNEDNFVVKNLKEEYDNIKVSFEFESLGDAYGEKNHVDSKYVCYYGVYNMLRNTVKDDCEDAGLRYYYHEINLENIFDKREPRWNWTGTIKGNSVTGAAANIKGYIVDPERLISYIENNGNKIYTDEDVQKQEMDYEYTLNNSKINSIRNYNNTKVKGKKIPYTTFTLDASTDKSGDNFSAKVAEWLGGTFKSKEISISSCNNTIAGSCYNYNLGGR